MIVEPRLTLPDAVQVGRAAPVLGAAGHQLSAVGVEVDVAHGLRHPQACVWENTMLHVHKR